MDAIINIKKRLPYEDYPADRADGLCSIEYMLANAHGVIDFLDEMAENTFRRYDAFTAGEVFHEKPEDLPRFIGDRGVFSSMFDFAETILNQSPLGWYDTKPVTAEQYKAACFASQKRVEQVGFLCNIIENHDEPRGVSHYIPAGQCTVAAKKMLGGLNFMLRGLPFLYQGQELGMENRRCASIDEVDDVSARDEYQVARDAGLTPEQAMEAVNRFSRDNARSPFQWDASPNAGFSEGTPWLPVNPNYTEINLAAQREDPDSVWNFYRKLIALRNDPAYRETVVYGELEPYLPDQTNLMAYFRRSADRTLLVLGNFQNTPQCAALPGTVGTVLINNIHTLQQEDGSVYLEPWQFVVLELEDRS